MSGISVGRWAGLSEAERAKDIQTALELAHRSPELFAVTAEYDLSAIAEAVAHAERPGRTGTVLLTSN
nr:hypothetical protein [Marinicella sp. W31]MDC2876129.1 hypothetical protein [Marinicella sp. W31]